MSQMETIIPVFDHSSQPNVGRMPPWIRQTLAHGEYSATAKRIHGHQLTTVCEEARCPNRGECWGQGTASFMLLGDTCTRACGFCAVKTGRPGLVDKDEPQRVVAAVEQMGLKYVVLTSVNRDDLTDGGAGVFAETLHLLRHSRPDLGLEVLTPDFRNNQERALHTLVSALGGQGEMVWGHNLETVPALYDTVRKGARYERSLDLLEKAAAHPQLEAKTALMLGLGETETQVFMVLEDLRDRGVQRLALGQYLRPSRYHLPVKEYISPEKFTAFEQAAWAMGFTWVMAGPMVRSSYHAEQQ